MKRHKGQSPSPYKMPQGQEPSSLLNTTTPHPINYCKTNKILLAQCAVLKGGEWQCGVEGGQGVMRKEGDPTNGFPFVSTRTKAPSPLYTLKGLKPLNPIKCGMS